MKNGRRGVPGGGHRIPARPTLPFRPAAIEDGGLLRLSGFLRFFCMRRSIVERGLWTPSRRQAFVQRRWPAGFVRQKRMPAGSPPAQECATVAHRCVIADAKMRHCVHLPLPSARRVRRSRASPGDVPSIARCRKLIHGDGGGVADARRARGIYRPIPTRMEVCGRRRPPPRCRSEGSRHRRRGTTPPSRSPRASRPSSSASATCDWSGLNSRPAATVASIHMAHLPVENTARFSLTRPAPRCRRSPCAPDALPPKCARLPRSRQLLPGPSGIFRVQALTARAGIGFRRIRTASPGWKRPTSALAT